MPRELKVYGWIGMRPSSEQENWREFGSQARYIVAAHSVAEVCRLANITRSAYNWTGRETGNNDEVATAMTEPGTVFYRKLDLREGDWRRGTE